MPKEGTTNRRIVLIYGDPGNGKSYLANDELKAKFGYYVIKTDARYVEFIRTNSPRLDFPNLPEIIQWHYQAIVPAASHVLGQDIAGQWVEYLCRIVEEESPKHALLAVEGYLVSPAMNAIEGRLRDKATIVKVEVRQHNYFIANTVDEIHSRDP